MKDYTWSDFRKAHSEALVRIVFNIGNPKSNVAAEFDYTIKGTDIFYKECVRLYKEKKGIFST